MRTKIIVFSAAAAIIAIISFVAVNKTIKTSPEQTALKKAKKEVKVSNKAMISVKNAQDLELMEERKKEYGVDQGLDMVLKSDEKTEISGKIIDLKSIEEKDRLARGELLSSDLKINETIEPKDYGIYVVKKGDNLWDVHFRLLRELFAKKGITLSESADEPLNGGYSSGVGKILKFSEETVSIYSLETGEVTTDINVLEPQGKVIIYKMSEISELLSDISMKNINKVVFDGKNLWIDTVN
ncbi:MAG: hypothetical protein AB7E04_04720 [Desulfobacteraceae bacterium]|jgi:hypothetical protein